MPLFLNKGYGTEIGYIQQISIGHVGDIQSDYESSKKAGVAFIHAAYGFGTIDDEVPEIENLSQLPEVVEKVFAGK